MTHEEIKAELSSYALGALDLDDLTAVERHLAGGCTECAAELASWHEIVGNLALTVPQAQMPALKEQLLRRVNAAHDGRLRASPRRATVGLALAASTLLGLGLTREFGWRNQAADQQQRVAILQSQLSDTKDQLQHLTDLLAAKEKDVTSLRTALTAAEETLAVIQRPGLQMVRLKETSDAKPAEGHVLMSAGNRRAVFYAFDLPAIASDKTYEFWWITEKQGPVKAGLFVPDVRGLGRIETAVPDDMGPIQAAAVTIEPRGGVPKPTGPMVLLGKL